MTHAAVWYQLAVGAVVESPSLTIGDDLIEDLVRLGGYVHPLFTDPDYVETISPLAARPLPGGALLHLMGGLAEQCGVLDGNVLALLGYDAVHFRVPVLAGDAVHLRMTIGDTTPSPRARRAELELGWELVRADGSVAVDAQARMLVAQPAVHADHGHPDPPGRTESCSDR